MEAQARSNDIGNKEVLINRRHELLTKISLFN